MKKEEKNKSLLENHNPNLAVFEKLCYKAKEIIFNTLEHDRTMQYIYVFGLDEELIELSPIEQIFYVSKDICTFFEGNFYLDILSQVPIYLKDKTYKVDFLVESYTYNGEKVVLENPIVIELDGYNYHSTKEQRNRDCQKENELKLAGYHVMRFTGTQVFNEPFQCLKSVYKYVLRLIGKGDKI